MCPATAPNSSMLSPQEQAFIEKNGLQYEKTYGLPRIAGRIVGLLMVSPKPISIQEIRKTLQFSHGSVSTNLRLLGMMSLVDKVTLPGDRCDYYQFSPAAWDEILKRRMENLHDLSNLAHQALEDLNPQGVVRDRFEEMLVWITLANQKYNEMVEEWSSRDRGTLISSNRPAG